MPWVHWLAGGWVHSVMMPERMMWNTHPKAEKLRAWSCGAWTRATAWRWWRHQVRVRAWRRIRTRCLHVNGCASADDSGNRDGAWVGDMRVTVDIYDEDVWEEETAVAHTPLQVRLRGGCGMMMASQQCVVVCAQVEGSGCAGLEWRLRVWVDGVKAWGVGAGGVVRALRGLVRRARVAALAAGANAGGGKAAGK